MVYLWSAKHMAPKGTFLANFLFKLPNNKYFRLCGSHIVSITYILLFSSPYIYKICSNSWAIQNRPQESKHTDYSLLTSALYCLWKQVCENVDGKAIRQLYNGGQFSAGSGKTKLGGCGQMLVFAGFGKWVHVYLPYCLLYFLYRQYIS